MAEEPQKKKRVSEEKITQFIKTLKRSEYSVINQLKKSAQISILSLLLSSLVHSDSLLKILNESYVPERTEMKDLEQIVGQIVGTNTITFNKDELTLEGIGHIKSPHITVECKGMIISWVLIAVDDFLTRPNGMMVRAFDGTRTSTCGEID